MFFIKCSILGRLSQVEHCASVYNNDISSGMSIVLVEQALQLSSVDIWMLCLSEAKSMVEFKTDQVWWCNLQLLS